MSPLRHFHFHKTLVGPPNTQGRKTRRACPIYVRSDFRYGTGLRSPDDALVMTKPLLFFSAYVAMTGIGIRQRLAREVSALKA